MRGHKSFIAFDRRPNPLVLEWIVKSLTVVKLQILEFWYQKDLYSEETSYQKRWGKLNIMRQVKVIKLWVCDWKLQTMARMCSQEVGDTPNAELSLYYDLCNQVYISIELLLYMSMFLFFILLLYKIWNYPYGEMKNLLKYRVKNGPAIKRYY